MEKVGERVGVGVKQSKIHEGEELELCIDKSYLEFIHKKRLHQVCLDSLTGW